MKEREGQGITWRAFGKQLLVSAAAHWLLIVGIWFVLLVLEESRHTPLIRPDGPSSSAFFNHWINFAKDLQPALLPGLLTFACLALAWSSLTITAPLSLSLGFCLISTLIGGIFAQFPLPDRAYPWLLWSGVETPRRMQLTNISIAGAIAFIFLMFRMTKQYERLNRDRLALSPSEEDLAMRSLVQSILMMVLIILGGVSLWNIANLRPVPAIALADSRELKPAVLIFAVDSEEHSKALQNHLGQPFFRSGVIFGSPNTSAKFEEIIQCRYPIRLIGQAKSVRQSNDPSFNDYLVTAALEKNGYLVNLLHTSLPGESSESLKMLSRNFSHIRLFRRFGLLLPSRVFYTPDVQLSQIRETLTQAVNRGKSAFLTASLMSREGRKLTHEDYEQFETFLTTLTDQNWTKNILIILVEFPTGAHEKSQRDLSIAATSAHVSLWASGSLADSALIQNPPKIVRGIDLGASLAARLGLASVTAQCDGTALFDISERPSVFPRDLVYQEVDTIYDKDVFRKRGWLTSDGYRLELEETQDGAHANTYKFGMKFGSSRRTWDMFDELSVSDQNITQELNRQLDDFLRTTGVEILNIGPGRTAYSEPFRKIRLLKE